MVRGVRCAPCAVDLGADRRPPCSGSAETGRVPRRKAGRALDNDSRSISLLSYIAGASRASSALSTSSRIHHTCSNTMWLSAPSLLDSGGIRLQRTSSYIGTSVPFGMVASEALAPPLALAPPPPMVAPSGLALRSLATPSNTAPHPACPTAAPRTHASLARGSMATVTRVGRCYARRGRRGGRNGSSNWC